LIETKNLEFSYNHGKENEFRVLKGLNFSVKKGSFTVILGHNGSGKSTLAKHFNAILLPCGGSCFVEGLDTKDPSLLWEIRKRVGMVFQNPDNQIVATVVEEDVAFGPENLGVKSEEIRKRVDNALKAVGMYEYRKSAPHHLSGGQKQRVAIAGIIAMEPEYIVLDEPTAMLDPVGRKEVIKTITNLNKTMGITIVLITHYMDEAVGADRVVVMDGGEIIMDGTPREVFRQVKALKDTGLDVPQVTELCYILRQNGVDIRDDVLTVDECREEIIKIYNKHSAKGQKYD